MEKRRTMKRSIVLLAFAAVAVLPAAGFAQQTSPMVAPSATPGIPAATTQPAALTQSPIQIEACKLYVKGTPLYGTTGILTISFTNEGNVTANVVRWKLMWGEGKVAYIRDEGTFSPGITIKHDFRQASGIVLSPLFANPNITCAPSMVKLENGQMWQASPNEHNGVTATLSYT